MTGRPPADPSTGASPDREAGSNGGSAPIDAAAVVVSNVIGSRHPADAGHRRAHGARLLGVDVGVAGRRPARLRRGDGLRRAGDDAAARRRRIRVPARRLRPAARLPHRVDVVRGRLLRRHRRRRRRPGRLPRRLGARARRPDAVVLALARRAVADALAAEPGGGDDHRRLQRGARGRPGPGPRRPEHARGDQGPRARRVRGGRPHVGPAAPGHRGADGGDRRGRDASAAGCWRWCR